jgi:hypothetical protein
MEAGIEYMAGSLLGEKKELDKGNKNASVMDGQSKTKGQGYQPGIQTERINVNSSTAISSVSLDTGVLRGFTEEGVNKGQYVTSYEHRRGE